MSPTGWLAVRMQQHKLIFQQTPLAKSWALAERKCQLQNSSLSPSLYEPISKNKTNGNECENPNNCRFKQRLLKLVSFV